MSYICAMCIFFTAYIFLNFHVFFSERGAFVATSSSAAPSDTLSPVVFLFFVRHRRRRIYQEKEGELLPLLFPLHRNCRVPYGPPETITETPSRVTKYKKR